MNEELRGAVEAVLGAGVTRSRPVAGGDVNDAFEVELVDGRRVFVKANERADRRMFPAEAEGLAWLAEPRCTRVPEVLAVSGAAGSGPCFLVLELITPAPRQAGFDELLGRSLAALHRSGAPSFGLDADNFIGSLPQSNRARATWAEFYRDERLEPLLQGAVARGHLGADTQRAFEQLYARLPELVGPAEPPARLHGDLWRGNLHVDETGAPCLIDPAVYGGHREMDLAMMRLFGGFSERCFAAYAEAHPLAPGAAERVALYQLYPLLVHVNLFGAAYSSSLEQALGRYVR